MDAKYRLGCDALDEQHTQLYDLLHNMQLMLGGRTLTTDHLLASYSELIDYIIFHFGYEENLMVLSQYPDIELHLAEHHKVIGRIGEMFDDMSNIQLCALDFILAVNSHFMKHIVKEDQKLVDWIKDHHPDLL